MRGKELDTLIEHELQLMLIEGFDKSPISAKALHTRLKGKGILNGGLSTLSSLERKRLMLPLYFSVRREVNAPPPLHLHIMS